MKPFVAAVFLFCLLSEPLRAQDHFEASPVATTIPDLQVVTQTGDHLHFNSQIVKGRIAIVTGFLTTCSSMCPITQEKLSEVARVLGPRLGKEVVIVSVSVDANRDTPKRMKAWGEKFHVGRGWVLAGGKKTRVDQLLKSLGLYVDVPQRHQSALMIGNDEYGWFRISSWAPTEKLVGLVDTLAARKNTVGVSSASR